ncbi:(Fe-S)-binding protein [Loigolactobacillus bifermentans]|nr:(Fe-S)-binding protein [Loigolactobacillus bifermentans]QGG60605.1 (Fe-S)-binding protein [Loigolactobacillus bifermentans]
MKVALFTSCMLDLMFPKVGQDMVDVLERLGCTIQVPSDQICCGQPTYNSGYVEASWPVLHNQIDAFADVDCDYIVSPVGSCTGILKEYPTLLEDDPTDPDGYYMKQAKILAAKTYEFSQFIWRVLGIADCGAQLDGVATYHRSCHMTRILGERETPFWLLEHVNGLEMRPLNGLQYCCGFGGTFSVKEPSISQLMVTEKVENIEKTGAEILVSCDPGCLMNIGGRFNRLGKPIKIMHLAEVLNTNVDPSRIRKVSEVPAPTPAPAEVDLS